MYIRSFLLAICLLLAVPEFNGATSIDDAGYHPIVIHRSLEQCRAECLPTRLIVACGHGGADCVEPYCTGHSKYYFTVALGDGDRGPDIQGNVWQLKGLIFSPNSWDFLTFECFPWKKDLNDENLRMIAQSLRPGGAWVIHEVQDFFPAEIIIGDQVLSGFGDSYSDLPCYANGSRNFIREIIKATGKMKNCSDDLATFANHDDFNKAVNDYFTALGFASAELVMLPGYFKRKGNK